MRLRNIPGSRERLLANPRLVLQGAAARPGGWRRFFAARGSRAERLALEIGCGRGRFVAELAESRPDLNVIGLELQQSVLDVALAKALAKPLANRAFLWANAAELAAYFAEGELDRIYLNFSDPWPKKRHAKRRLTYKSFLAAYARLLAPGGELWLKTDNRGMFEFSCDSLLANGWRLAETDWDYALGGAAEDAPTEYELRFRRLGQPIFRLRAVYNGPYNKENGVNAMRYISTRGEGAAVSSAAAIRQGLAADGGLFVPENIPAWPYSWEELAAMSYQTLAAKVMGLYLTDYAPERLQEIVNESYGANFDTPEIAPVAKLAGGMHILELWHGPTAAFKDMALQILPRLLTEAVRLEGGGSEVDILVATSGDTGKAALEGFKNVAGIKVICFYPHGGVSRAQYLQMATTDGVNTYVAAVQGNFDDCQSGVKKIFADEAMQERLGLAGKEFSSANSINWGRLCPQIVYYFWSYAQMLRTGSVKPGEEFNVAVPTGNFGNILAAYFAKEMGLPIHRLICASNSNRVLADALNDGVYDKRREFVKTTSPSMDILISSNFERFYWAMTGGDCDKVRAAYGRLGAEGIFTADEAAKASWDGLMSGGFADEERVAATVGKYFREQGYALDPHTAVAVAVYEDYAAASGDKLPVVIASTASPFKFGRAVLAALGEDVIEDNEEAVLRQLAAKIGKPVHRGLAGIERLEVRHNTVIKAEDMPEYVATTLEV